MVDAVEDLKALHFGHALQGNRLVGPADDAVVLVPPAVGGAVDYLRPFRLDGLQDRHDVREGEVLVEDLVGSERGIRGHGLSREKAASIAPSASPSGFAAHASAIAKT